MAARSKPGEEVVEEVLEEEKSRVREFTHAGHVGTRVPA